MRVFVASLIAFTLSLGVPAAGIGAESHELRIRRIEHYKETEQYIGSVDRVSVVLSNGRSLKIPLYGANPIAILTASDGSHFLLAEGSNCTMCDEGRTIRLFLIGSGELKETQERYDYPGRLKDFMSDELVQTARVFYGRCIDEPGDVVVWFADYIGDDAKWHRKNAIARLTHTGETFVKDVKLSLARVLKSVAARRCTELPGVEHTTEP